LKGDEAAYATRTVDAVTISTNETFARRLAEARAFALACNGLANRYPQFSAKGGLSSGQRLILLIAVAAAGSVTFFWPESTLQATIAFLSGTFGLIIALRLAAAMSAAFPRAKQAIQRTPDYELPRLTMLVALLREGEEVVGQLIRHIAKLDYPLDKLDVKLLVEADDDLTLQAVEATRPRELSVEVIPVPPGEPRTKPKALNYGLSFARGDIIVVFDAEDRPSPGQAREAVAAFQRGSKDLAIIQAPLLIHNRDEGWPAGQFDVEYAIHFNVWLPFLSRCDIPFPLGGTSNYFRRDALIAAGGWDAWNVTEDADLGLRLSRFGCKATMISSPTYEEAPFRLSHWFDQRTRWMKGHIQTWLVLMRQPFSAIRGMGLLRFTAMQLTFGGSLLASAMHAPMIVYLIATLFGAPTWLNGWHGVLFGVGYGSVLAAALASKTARPSLATCVLLPVYWVLHSIAMTRALLQMISRPHYWAKTPHGEAARKGLRR
jgi:cellulose synthase/poly-beta-1,6-N-acetylglucosamine synthase-like glycosyltransferase